MFTVKATYRSETRKFTFLNDTFPSFDQLSSQIYKVFPLANAYFFSQLIFSPNPNAPGQSLLIGREVHSAEDYDKHVDQYKHRFWPGALLKFTVLDETPHKTPGTVPGRHTMEEDTQVSRPASVVLSDVSQTPSPAANAEIPSIRLEDDGLSPTDSGRGFMLDPIRERIRSQIANASNRNSLASTVTVRVTDDEYGDETYDEMSETNTEVPEATPRLPSRLPSVSSATRLSQILRTLQSQTEPQGNDAREASSSAMPSDRMARLQETILRMRDQSIRLKEASEALKERSSVLRQQPMDDIRALSPISDSSTVPSESTVQRVNLVAAGVTRQEPSSSQQGQDELADIGERDTYWRSRMLTRLRTTVESPPLESPPLPDDASSASSPIEMSVASPVSNSASAFDEASQRTVHLGLELLRRSSSFCSTQPEEDAQSDEIHEDSSSEEESGTIWRFASRRKAENSQEATEDRDRSRLSMLSRLTVRRPLPPCPAPALQVSSSRGRSPSPVPSSPGCLSVRSPSCVSARSPSPDCRLDYGKNRPPSFVCSFETSPAISPRRERSYRPGSPGPSIPQPPTRYVYSPSSNGSRSPVMPNVIAPTVNVAPTTRIQSPPIVYLPYRTYSMPSTRSSTPAAEHNCGWSAECDKLKRQIDGVQMALADLRCDFEVAVSDRRLGPEQAEAPTTAQTAAGSGAQRLGHALPSSPPALFPPGFVPSLPVAPPDFSLFYPSHSYPSFPMPVPTRMPPPESASPFSIGNFANRYLDESLVNQALFRIDCNKLPVLKEDLGLAHKDLSSLTMDEKLRIVELAKARNVIPMDPPPVAVRVHSPMVRRSSSPASAYAINRELFMIECSKLPELKQELGLAHRDLPSLNCEEKARIVGLAKARGLLSMRPPPVPTRVEYLRGPSPPTPFPSATSLQNVQSPGAAMIHPNIICDGCGEVVIGVRHKCLDCANFDLCSRCLNNPQVRRGHNAKHGLFPIDVPGDSTTFEAVQSDRKGVEHYGITCDGCSTRVHGVRHKCIECPDFDLCEECVSSTALRSEHEYGHHFFPIEYPWDHDAFRDAAAQVLVPKPKKPVHRASCDGCNKAIEGVRHRCLACDDFDFCSTCLADPEKRFAHDLSHSFFPITSQRERAGFDAVRARMNAANEGPVIHANIVCNQCEDIIIGVRHKCLDCVNYDLCGDCVAQGAKRNHNSAHQFFEIAKPGEVIVHTVYMNEPAATPISSSRVAQEPPVVHNAVCNLCDSTIRGDRYKCFNCPDFDTCQACFAITPEHHPGHGFVKVGDPENLVLRDILRSHVVHSARCNECNETIRGTRYKCLHEDCPDYDLCQDCEATPIAVHPLTHPLVKLRVPETLIPAVEAPIRYVATPVLVARSPSVPYTPVPNPGSWATWQPTGGYDRSPSESPSPPLECRLLPSPPTIPPVIPASWTPPESWRWNMTPPGPMVVPRMVSQETTPLFQCGASVRTVSPPVLENNVVSVVIPSPPRVRTPLGCTLPLVRPSVEVPAPHIATPKRVASPVPLPRSPPAQVLIDFDEQSTTPQSAVVTPMATSSLQGLTTPSEDSGSAAALVRPAPRIEPVGEQEWRELWPELTGMLRHLLQPTEPAVLETVNNEAGPVAMPGAMTAETQETTTTTQEYRTAPDESPLAGEALLSRPIPAEMSERSRDFGHNLRELLNRVSPLAPSLPTPPLVTARCQATFISDNNIADGQIFPPGAEFVKSWKMRNEGDIAWPEETTLRYVAGDRLSPAEGLALCVPVGCVLPGADVELIGGEMKAPDVPGKYVSYWRLHDGNEFFGNSVWVDIEVAEPSHEKESSDESLAASSVIMPPVPSAGAETQASANTGMSAPPSTAVLTGSPSDDGSYDSSVSLIDAPSSPSIEDMDGFEDDDEDIFQDSREIVVSPAAPARDLEYVVLYDTSSSEDEQ